MTEKVTTAGQALCKALGLDPARVASITIRADWREVVVDVRMSVSRNKLLDLEEEFQQFELVAKK